MPNVALPVGSPLLVSVLRGQHFEVLVISAQTELQHEHIRKHDNGTLPMPIAELREVGIPGLQTFGEFTERRLAPAMNTCRAIAGRQESLSQRVARANQLLATRVDLTRERQNQALRPN